MFSSGFNLLVVLFLLLGVKHLVNAFDTFDKTSAKPQFKSIQSTVTTSHHFDEEADRYSIGNSNLGGSRALNRQLRRLTQESNSSGDEGEFQCGLDPQERNQLYNRSSGQWVINDQAVDVLEGDLQALINCTSDGDILVFDTSTVIRPSSRILLPWNLTLTSQSNRDLTGNSEVTRSSRKTGFICPEEGELFVARAHALTLANLMFSDCNTTASVIALSAECEDSQPIGNIRLLHLAFESLSLYGNASIIDASGSPCSRIEMEDILLRRNWCNTTDCVQLSSENILNDIRLKRNKGGNDTSVFITPAGSHTDAKEIFSIKNELRSFYISNSTLDLKNSIFEFNERIQKPGGGVIYLNYSSASIQSSVFSNNYCLKGGGAIYARQSQFNISNCTFTENTAGSGYGGALSSHFGGTIFLSSILFSKNRGVYGGSFYARGHSDIQMEDVQFLESVSANLGAAYLQNTTVDIHSCEFTRNINGSLAGDEVQLSLNNSRFVKNEGMLGGACYFERSSEIQVENSFWYRNKALGTTEGGGGLYLADDCNLTVSNSVFQKNHASPHGGAIYAFTRARVILQEVDFLGNEADIDGGAIQIWGGMLDGRRLKFKNNKASSGNGGAIELYQATNVTVISSAFRQNSAVFSGGAINAGTSSLISLRDNVFLSNSAEGSGGAVSGLRSRLTISSAQFDSNSGTEDGGALSMEAANVAIQDCQFTSNNGKRGNGGVMFFTQRSRATISNSNFSVSEGRQGGALYADGRSRLTITDSNCTVNKARFGGCLFLEESSKADVSNCYFENNTAQRDGGAVFMHNQCRLEISGSTMQGNVAEQSGGFTHAVDGCTVSISSSEVVSNKATSGGAAFIKERGQFSGRQIVLENNSAGSSGGGVYAEEDVEIRLIDSKVTGNNGSRGGGVAIIGRGIVICRNTAFMKNTAKQYGGAISVESSNNFSLSQCNLSSNRALTGGAVYLLHGALEIRNSLMEKNHAGERGGALYADAMTLRVVNSRFRKNIAEGGGSFYLSSGNATLLKTTLFSNEATRNCGGICATNGTHLNGSSLTLRSNKAEKSGGGMLIEPDSSLLCYTCRFHSNRAQRGGGLHVQSGMQIPVIVQLQNSVFQDNVASDYGGGLVFSGQHTRIPDCSNPEITCDYVLLLSTTFVKNHAQNSGGALFAIDTSRVVVSCDYSSSRQESFLSQETFSSMQQVDPKPICPSWKENRLRTNAVGKVVGTFGRTISLHMEEENGTFLDGNPQAGYRLKKVTGGRPLPQIKITVEDEFGKGPVPTDPPSFNLTMSSPGGDFFVGFYVAEIKNGCGVFEEIVGFRPPRDNYIVQIVPDTENIEPLNLTVEVRSCKIGEEPTTQHKLCQRCDDSYHNFDTTDSGKCERCPEHSDCTGNYILPEKRYWNHSPCHRELKECLTEEACSFENRTEDLEVITTNETDCNSTTGWERYRQKQCKKGYEGPLCGSCQASYGLSLNFRCLRCHSRFLSFLTLFALMLYLFGTACFTIRGGLPKRPRSLKTISSRMLDRSVVWNSARSVAINFRMVEMMRDGHVPKERLEGSTGSSQPSRTLSQPDVESEITRWRVTELFKIKINFLQVTAVAASVNVRWTEGLIQMYKASGILSALTIAAVSKPIDCLISSSSAVVRSVWRTLLSLFVPCAVIGSFAVFWGTVSLRQQKGFAYFSKRLLLSAIAVIYISYLGLTRLAVRVFYCLDIYDSDDYESDSKTRYWALDTAIECYAKEHVSLVLIAAFVLFSVSFSFPLVSALVLTRNSERRRQDSWIFETMGFLYRVLKEEFVYWECIVMLRKACLSMIVVFSDPLGGQSQSSLAMIVLLVSLYAHLLCSPYKKEFHQLNYFESGSLLVSCLTFILGQFLTDDHRNSSTKFLIAAIILSVNIGFFLILLGALLHSGFVHIKAILKEEEVYIPNGAGWMEIIKLYIRSRISNYYSSSI